MFTPPDVPAWKRAFDIVLSSPHVRDAPQSLGVMFYAFHLYDFCGTYHKKFERESWAGFRTPLDSDPPEYAGHRAVMHDVLKYELFYRYIPTYYHRSVYVLDVETMRKRRNEAYENLLRAGAVSFVMRFNEQTYEVTADLTGTGPYITPHPAPGVEASVYALADILAPCPGLWEAASA